MSDMTNYLQGKLVNAIFNGVTFQGTGNYYAALFTSDPTKKGNQDDEVTDNSYERQSITFSSTQDGITTNSVEITFSPAEVGYGTVTHIGVLDSPTGGNILFYKRFGVAIDVGEDKGVRIIEGNLSIELD